MLLIAAESHLKVRPSGAVIAVPVDCTQAQKDAVREAARLVGLGNLQRSGLRMKTNRGDFDEAADEFLKWTKAAGRVLPGLVKRRKDEQALYLSGVA